jgi:mono/diheme cytochrome c family protein
VGQDVAQRGALSVAQRVAQPQPPRKATEFTENSTVDELLGRQQRERFAASLQSKPIQGRSYRWQEYSAWGRELLIDGRVLRPPTSAQPSTLLSTKYTCVHCHNLAREDVALNQLDPEARAGRIRNAQPADPAKRDGTVLGLTTGTTLWGVVNREHFFNGTYEKYHHVKLPDGRRMNTESLADAIQVCGKHCSAGRFLEPWELDSVMASLWDLELRLKDVDLSPEAKGQIVAQMNGGKPDEVRAARNRLKLSYLRAGDGTMGAVPVQTAGDVDVYPNNQRVTGDAQRGKWLYQSACACCHGTSVNAVKDAALVPSDAHFHKLVWQGAESADHYMPFFPLERLSRQQVTDVRVYLKTLK